MSQLQVHAELFLWLLVIYQVKHFFADFVFQNVWMLQKSRPGWEFVLPLAIHAGIHALFTLIVVMYLNPSLWWLGILDFTVHFALDRLKAGPRYLGRFGDMRKSSFWIAFGFDQMAHHLTHIYICWVIVTTAGLRVI